MLGAGTVINPIIKIVTVVAILGATYLFIVKPVLDTAESTIDRSFDAFDQSFSGFDDLPGQIQTEIEEAGDASNNPQALENCIRRAIGQGDTPNTQRINRCVARFTP